MFSLDRFDPSTIVTNEDWLESAAAFWTTKFSAMPASAPLFRGEIKSAFYHKRCSTFSKLPFPAIPLIDCEAYVSGIENSIKNDSRFSSRLTENGKLAFYDHEEQANVSSSAVSKIEASSTVEDKAVVSSSAVSKIEASSTVEDMVTSWIKKVKQHGRVGFLVFEKKCKRIYQMASF